MRLNRFAVTSKIVNIDVPIINPINSLVVRILSEEIGDAILRHNTVGGIDSSSKMNKKHLFLQQKDDIVINFLNLLYWS